MLVTSAILVAFAFRLRHTTPCTHDRLGLVIQNAHEQVANVAGASGGTVVVGSDVQTVGGDDIPAEQIHDEALATGHAAFQNLLAERANIVSDGYETVQGGLYNRVTDEYTTFRGDVGLIKSQTHTDQVAKGKDAIGLSRDDLVREAIDVMRASVGCVVSATSLQEVGLEGLLDGTGAFSSTLCQQTLNVGAVFTQVIGTVGISTY